MAVAYPASLPTAGLNGASGGPVLTTISDEREFGIPEIRQRQSMTNQVISVEYPPINQTTYEAFLTWFQDDLYDGILPFTFNDPITKDNHVYKFVKSNPAFVETRMSPGWLKLSFQLIRLKFVAAP